MRSISVLRLVFVYRIYRGFRIYFEWKKIEEIIAIWKQNMKMFIGDILLFFFFVIESTLFIDKKKKHNEKYQKKKFGLVWLVTQNYHKIIQQSFVSIHS